MEKWILKNKGEPKMIKTEEFIALRNKEDGRVLVDYKNNKHTFAYSARFSDSMKDAAVIPKKNFKEDERFSKLADVFGCEPIIVTATYELKALDGSEPKELIKKEKSLKEILAMIADIEGETEDD